MRHRTGGWALLARHMAPQRRALGRVALWSMVESLPALVSGLVVAAALDQGFFEGRPGVGLGWLSLLALALALRALAIRRLFPWLAEAVEPLRDGLVRDVAAAAVARGVATARAPDSAAVAQLSEQVESVRLLVSALLRTGRSAVLAMAASLTGIALLAPSVALLVVPPVLLTLVIYLASLRSLSARQRAAVMAGEATAAGCGEVLGGLRDVVACRAEARAAAAVGERIEGDARADRALARAATIRTVIVAVGQHVPLLAVLLAAPWLVTGQLLSPGVMTGVIVFIAIGLGPAFTSLVQVTGGLGLNLAVSLHRLAQACAPPETVATGRLVPVGQDLTVDHVTFAYGPHAEPVVRDLSLELRPGEHLAVVGASGVGKSTLANLLAGILLPQAGAVRLGGVPLPHVDGEHLRARIALIPQEAYIFAGSLRENLVYLRPDADDGDVDKAVEAVGLGAVVERLGGYDALLGPGGAQLSAGERQLVALVRVYLSWASVVLLDEATCHLDPIAEAQAEQAFAARSGIVVVIAHRISSVLRADRILLMDGATHLIGTHEQLLAASPLYADLVGHWQSAPERNGHVKSSAASKFDADEVRIWRT